MSTTMIQASDIKEILENQGITCNKSTTASTDAEDFCPSVRLKPVRKEVCHFSKNPPDEDQINIEHCTMKFGMQSRQLAFADKCYEHDVDRNPEENGPKHASKQSTVWTDNNHGNKQEPATRQNLPDNTSKLSTCMPSCRKDSNIDWTTATQRRSQSFWTSQRQFQKQTQQEEEDNLFLHLTFQLLVQTCRFNPQNHQRQIEPPMAESVCVLPQIHQPQRDIPRWSVQEAHNRSDLPRFSTSALQLQNMRNWCLWLQQNVQEFNSSPQSQMQQHRKSAHRKHTTKFGSQNATTPQWCSPNARQTWQEIGLLCQTLFNQLHFANPSPMNQHGGMICSIIWQDNPISVVKTSATKNRALVLCQREKCSSQTIQIQPTTSCQLWQWNLWCRQTQTPFQWACEADHPQHFMSHSMTKESAQCMKSPQILLGALFA